jgi:hypothetical protein
MTARHRLPNRRWCESFEFRHAGLAFTLCAGFYRDAAIVTSLALQHGADLDTIRGALTKDHDGSAATPLGAAIDMLAGAP